MHGYRGTKSFTRVGITHFGAFHFPLGPTLAPVPITAVGVWGHEFRSLIDDFVAAQPQ